MIARRRPAVVPLVPAGVPVLLAALVPVVAVLAGPVPPGPADRPGWVAILATAAGCYLLKLAGLSLPARGLECPRDPGSRTLLPVALLAALAAVQTFSTGDHLVLDARVAGVAAAVVALLLRAPFLVVVAVAAATAALLRLVT